MVSNRKGILMEFSTNNIDFSSIDKKIIHLSKEQVMEVITSYYGGEKIKDTLARYEIKTTFKFNRKALNPLSGKESRPYLREDLIIVNTI